MAATPKRLDVSELDFDDIKDNLKVFLKGQTEFTDYDFEGSGMNILLDVLAYNTHYLSFNANMLANEMFLDSSALRSSVVSHAKTLGYVPTQPLLRWSILLHTPLLLLVQLLGGLFLTRIEWLYDPRCLWPHDNNQTHLHNNL